MNNTPDEKRILFVDDDTNLLDSFNRLFGRNYNLATASGALEALKQLENGNSFAVVVSDMRMRGMDGIALLKELRRRAPGTIRILLTGMGDQAVAVRAINEGHVFAFLNKPVTPEALREVLDDALTHWRMRSNEREFLDRAIGDIDFS
jgi:DNA-binding NtrC family response regulator